MSDQANSAAIAALHQELRDKGDAAMAAYHEAIRQLPEPVADIIAVVLTLPDGRSHYAEGTRAHLEELKVKVQATAAEFLDKPDRSKVVRPVYAPPAQPEYAIARQEAYPSIGDQLDAIWKGPDHPDFKAMMAQIAAVKAAHPKG